MCELLFCILERTLVVSLHNIIIIHVIKIRIPPLYNAEDAHVILAIAIACLG